MKWGRISTMNLNWIVVGLAFLLAKLSKGKPDHPTGEGQHRP